MRHLILKKLIHLDKHMFHMRVTFKLNGKQVRVTTNVHSRLTGFELNALRVYVYRVIERYPETSTIRDQLKSTNYAKVFGTPWTLEQLGYKS